MTTKKEVQELKNEIENLRNINENLNRELELEFSRRKDSIARCMTLENSNNHLQDSLERAIRAREHYFIMNMNLMYAIAAMGEAITNKAEAGNNHLCNPKTISNPMEVYQAPNTNMSDDKKYK